MSESSGPTFPLETAREQEDPVLTSEDVVQQELLGPGGGGQEGAGEQDQLGKHTTRVSGISTTRMFRCASSNSRNTRSSSPILSYEASGFHEYLEYLGEQLDKY